MESSVLQPDSLLQEEFVVFRNAGFIKDKSNERGHSKTAF